MTINPTPFPNDVAVLQPKVEAGMITQTWPIIMTIIRLVGFAGFQLLIAALYWFLGFPAPWQASAAWWPITALLTNLVCITLLVFLFHREGLRYLDLFRPERYRIGRDLLITLGALIVSVPLVLLPNFWLGTALYGNPEITQELFFRPLPPIAAWFALILFPLTIALAELPTYFGYAMPRLAVLWQKPWAAVLVTSGFLAAQHMTLPLVFDWRFILWRMGMFLPFAFFVGFLLWRRPRLLIFLVILHGLLDLMAVLMVFSRSTII